MALLPLFQVIAIFLIIGIIFVPVGLICLQASNRVIDFFSCLVDAELPLVRLSC